MARKPLQSMDTLGDEFHVMVGFCITEWARVDDKIFSVFRHCVGPIKQCAIIYYRVPGLDARVGLTGEIVGSVLPKPARKSGGHLHPLVKEWCAIETEIRELLSVRRRIAHQPVMIQSRIWRSAALNTFAFNEAAFTTPGEIESWFEIYTNQHERLRERESDKQSLTVDHLAAHLAAVNGLLPRMHKFIDKLAAMLAEALPTPDSPQKTGT
jgi:hypothetical protein